MSEPASNRRLVKTLSKVLYEVVEHHVSIDVAFKRASRLARVKNLEEREELYRLARRLVSDYIRLTCVIGGRRPYGALVRAWLKGVSKPTDRLPPWCRLSYPEWYYRKLVALLGKNEAEELLRAMGDRVWWLRINTLKGSVESVVRELEREGVELQVDRHFPYLARVIRSPKPIRLLRPVKEFRAIPQDKASIAVVEALRPCEGELIVDMASAPGLKTSLIMALTENKARVVAADISRRRIVNEAMLLRKLGVDMSRVHLVLTDSSSLNLSTRADKVLLDAPCSNSGAVGKDPGVKIHLTPSKVLHYARIQSELLRRAVELGEIVVYSTCSVMPEEGELVTASVHDMVKLRRIFSWSSPGYGVTDFSSAVMRFFPHKHATEAFYLAVLETH